VQSIASVLGHFRVQGGLITGCLSTEKGADSLFPLDCPQFNKSQMQKMHAQDNHGATGQTSNATGQGDGSTRTMALSELPLSHQMDVAIKTIDEHYPHIAKAILNFWGYKECDEYLGKLIYDGSDVKSHTRVGFRPEVMTALLSLQSLHVVTMRS
jgi:hypothetical protein